MFSNFVFNSQYREVSVPRPKYSHAKVGPRAFLTKLSDSEPNAFLFVQFLPAEYRVIRSVRGRETMSKIGDCEASFDPGDEVKVGVKKSRNDKSFLRVLEPTPCWVRDSSLERIFEVRFQI